VPFRFQTKYYDRESGLLYFGHRYYAPSTGKWLTRDPLGERGGLNLTQAFGGDPVNGVDAVGLEWYKPWNGDFFLWEGAKTVGRGVVWTGEKAWDGTKAVGRGVGWTASKVLHGAVGTMTGARVVVGTAGSIIDLDVFRAKGQSPVDITAKDCSQYLLTVNGIWNSHQQVMEFPRELRKAFPDTFGRIANVGYVDNPTTYLTDFVQIGFLEAKGIGVPSITTAKYIREAYNRARQEGAKNIDIYIVAHSQGAAILKNALPLVPKEIEKHLRILTIGAENQIDDQGQFGFLKNIGNKGDVVPYLSFWNWGVEQEKIENTEEPGHPRRNYIEYLKRCGLPPNYFVDPNR
jgi:RHS repeat-associated protein